MGTYVFGLPLDLGMKPYNTFGKTECFLHVLRTEVKISPVLGTYISRLKGGSDNVLLWFPEHFTGRF